MNSFYILFKLLDDDVLTSSSVKTNFCNVEPPDLGGSTSVTVSRALQSRISGVISFTMTFLSAMFANVPV